MMALCPKVTVWKTSNLSAHSPAPFTASYVLLLIGHKLHPTKGSSLCIAQPLLVLLPVAFAISPGWGVGPEKS